MTKKMPLVINQCSECPFMHMDRVGRYCSLIGSAVDDYGIDFDCPLEDEETE